MAPEIFDQENNKIFLKAFFETIASELINYFPFMKYSSVPRWGIETGLST